MGISGVSIGSLLIVLVIVMLLFGTKRLRTIGGDLGGAIRGFRSAVSDTDQVTHSLRIDAGGVSSAELLKSSDKAISKD